MLLSLTADIMKYTGMVIYSGTIFEISFMKLNNLLQELQTKRHKERSAKQCTTHYFPTTAKIYENVYS
jgi:hypothetical protein